MSDETYGDRWNREARIVWENFGPGRQNSESIGPIPENVQPCVDLLNRLAQMPDFQPTTISSILGIQLPPASSQPRNTNYDISGQLLSGPFESVTVRMLGENGTGVFMMLKARLDAAPIFPEHVNQVYKKPRILQVLSEQNIITFRYEPLNRMELILTFAFNSPNVLIRVRLGPFIKDKQPGKP